MESLKVSQMLAPQLVSVSPDADITDVLRLMQQKNCSCVVVVSADNAPVGMFTEHHLVHQLAKHKGALNGTVAHFAAPAVTITKDTHRNDAFLKMTEHQVSHLVVVGSDGQLIGIVGNKDFTDHFLNFPVSVTLQVADVMSHRVVSLHPDDSLQQAITMMDNAHISSVIVVKDNQALGIISERDIVSLALKTEQHHTVQLSEIMHSPVMTVNSKSLIVSALQHMDQQNVRRFVVTDDNNGIAGIITRHDISRAIQMSYVNFLEAEISRKELQFLNLRKQLNQIDQPSLLNSLIDQLQDGIFILQADSLLIIDANEQACHQLGYELEELVGQPISTVSKFAENLNISEFRKKAKRHKSLVFRTEHRCKNNELLPVEVKTSLISLGGDEFFISSVRDISERIRSEEELIEREETYRSVIETAMDGFWIADMSGQILEVNQAYCKMTGYRQDEVLQMKISDLDYRESPAQTEEHIEKVHNCRHEMFETQHQCKDGSVIDVEVKTSYWPRHGGRFFVHIKDITQKNLNEVRLKQAAAVFENTNEAVMVVSAQRKIQRVNKAFCRMTGYSEEDVLGRSPALLQSGEHDRRFYRAMWHNIRTYGHWQGEMISRRADGSVYPELLNISSVKDSDGQITHYVGVFADLSEQKQSESRLMFLDYHDPLTGLANRKNLMMRSDYAIRQLSKDHHQVALIVIGLDRFKNVNDSYGHSSGDELLRHIAAMLDQEVPQADTICRLGGDEFALLFDNLEDNNELIRIANSLIKRISQPWKLSDNRIVKLGASMGISLAPQNAMNADTLLQNADAALFQAKNEGRSRLRFFSDELTENARHRLELETSMHAALQNNELEVYYQPQVDILSQEITGAEALVRWIHPSKGMIPPNDFIPQCEENGLIHDVGMRVLEITCRQGKLWLDAGFEPIQLAVNLSAVQLSNPELYVHVTRILLETGFPPQQLEFELTESSLMGNPEHTLKLLQQFRAIGIKLAMDDFGTGYSSFTQLKQMPLDLLKIDKSFVDDIVHNQDDFEIVGAITAMGHALGLEVLAEGVEVKEQLHSLADLKCDRYQGYLLSRPVPAEEFIDLRKRHKAEHSINFTI